MLKNIIIIPIILFCLYDFSFAEIIDGPANVREEPNGKAIFSLYDSVKVYCGSEENGWFKIHISIQRVENDIYTDSRNWIFFKKGKFLVDWWTKKKIGTAKQDFEMHIVSHGEKLFDITGYIKKNNIYQESIVENPSFRLRVRFKLYHGINWVRRFSGKSAYDYPFALLAHAELFSRKQKLC